MKTLNKSAVSIFIVFFMVYILVGMVINSSLSFIDVLYSILLVLFLFKL